MDDFYFFTFAKDRQFRYTHASESLAEAAGVDSPQQMIGKKDSDLVWADQSEYYAKGDQFILDGGSLNNNLEIQHQVTYGKRKILVNKNQLLGSRGNCMGIVGSFIYAANTTSDNLPGYFDLETQRFYLGNEFDNEYFCRQEIRVLYYIMRGHSAQQIAHKLNLSAKTVESYTDRIKLKLQASSKGEIIERCISSKFYHSKIEFYKACISKKD